MCLPPATYPLPASADQACLAAWQCVRCRDEVELALDTCIRGLDDLRMAGGLDARKAGFLW